MTKTFRQDLHEILCQPVKTFTYADSEEHISGQTLPVLLDQIERAVLELIKRAKPVNHDCPSDEFLYRLENELGVPQGPPPDGLADHIRTHQFFPSTEINDRPDKDS